MDVQEQINRILKYYEENPGCDPNLSEYFGLCYDMVQYLNKEAPTYGIWTAGAKVYPKACATMNSFKSLSQQVSQKLLGNNLRITEKSALYRLYQDLSMSVETYSAYGDTPLKQMLGDVALFLAQQERSFIRGEVSEISYSNTEQMTKIEMLNLQMHDPQAVGYYSTLEGNVPPAITPRQQLYEQIRSEYQKGPHTLFDNFSR